MEDPATQVCKKNCGSLSAGPKPGEMGRVVAGRASGVKTLHAKHFSMRDLSVFTPDRSGPGIKTTVTSDLSPKVTSGHATWVPRKSGKQWKKKKERNEERKKAKKFKLKVGSLNVGTMTGKGKEVADLIERRRVGVQCVHCAKNTIEGS